jgi:serine/threonine protein kinase
MSHPNIVRCLGFGRSQGYYVMILEFVDGTDLRQLIGPMHLARRPLDLARAREIFTGVSAGLVTAHKINLLHRDIKPDNILIRSRDGIAKLADFGISKIMQSGGTGSGTVAGTLPYMAPEALNGRPGIASDLWSLSVTLYEMVTGRLPFWDENLFVLKQKIDLDEPVAPQRLNPEVDDRLAELMLRGLEKDPKRRFRSAQEMLDAAGPRMDEMVDELRQLFQRGEEAEAERRARSLVGQHPREPRLYMLLGELCNRRQQFLQAEEIVRRGIQACPEHAGLYYYLAPALWFQGRQKKAHAIAAMERALELGLGAAQEKQARNLLGRWKRGGG